MGWLYAWRSLRLWSVERAPDDFDDAQLRESMEVVRRIGAWLAASQREGAHDVTVLGHDFVVLPGVFSPRYYPETAFYAKHLLGEVRTGMRFLDMGCGVGVNAVLAAAAGARVVACDINQQAVANTKLNAKRHGVEVDVRCSNIFSALDQGERFDLVYWNIPFTYRRPGTLLSPLEEAIYDPGYRKNCTFLKRVGAYLAPSGLVLVGASSTLGDLPTILRVAAEAGLNLKIHAATLEAGVDPPTWLELLFGRSR
jgi:release factor glutamine methyltransferase